jgi:hypothetical protein
VKPKRPLATGEHSGLGHLISVDALNMLERFDAGSGAGRRDNLTLAMAALGKATRQFLDFRLEGE